MAGADIPMVSIEVWARLVPSSDAPVRLNVPLDFDPKTENPDVNELAGILDRRASFVTFETPYNEVFRVAATITDDRGENYVIGGVRELGRAKYMQLDCVLVKP